MEKLLGGEFSIEELNEYLVSYVNALPSSEKYKLEIANSIWFRNQGFAPNEEFLQTNKNYYDAEIYSAPFDNTTTEEMNKWISENTDGLIEKAIDEISPDAIMYLINAILFDAEWATKYNEYSIKEGIFNSIDGKEQEVEMMASGERFYIELDNAVGFKKNYESGKYSFVALLPDEGIDISDFVSTLEGEKLLAALENQSYKRIVAKTPKFSYDFEINLNSILAELGMEIAFNSSTADFSGIGGAGGNIYISSVVHKTFIAVDEAGTKAGAVTIVVDGAESAPEVVESIYITLDRPFVYMIVDNATNLPIFMGTLTSINN
jgi:serpin B